MTLQLADLCADTTTTTGTGTITLANALPAGAPLTWSTISDTLMDGVTTRFSIEDLATGDKEVSEGIFSASGPTLSRVTVLSSSNRGAKVSFAADTKNVIIGLPAEIAYGIPSVPIPLKAWLWDALPDAADLPVVADGTAVASWASGSLESTAKQLAEATRIPGEPVIHDCRT